MTRVDLAWTPAWIGTDQVGIWRIEGDWLFIETEEQAHPVRPDLMGRYRLRWRRHPED